MNFLIMFLPILAVSFSMLTWFLRLKSNDEDYPMFPPDGHVIIRYPRLVSVLGYLTWIGNTIAFCILFSYGDMNSIIVVIGCVLLGMGCVIGEGLIHLYCIWRLDGVLYEDFFFYRDLKAMVHRIRYSECMSLTRGHYFYILKTESKQIIIPIQALKANDLISMLKQHGVQA